MDNVTWLDAIKTNSKKAVNKTTKTTGKFIEKKIAKDIRKPKLITHENSRNVEEIIIPRQVLQKRTA